MKEILDPPNISWNQQIAEGKVEDMSDSELVAELEVRGIKLPSEWRASLEETLVETLIWEEESK